MNELFSSTFVRIPRRDLEQLRAQVAAAQWQTTCRRLDRALQKIVTWLQTGGYTNDQ